MMINTAAAGGCGLIEQLVLCVVNEVTGSQQKDQTESKYDAEKR